MVWRRHLTSQNDVRRATASGPGEVQQHFLFLISFNKFYMNSFMHKGCDSWRHPPPPPPPVFIRRNDGNAGLKFTQQKCLSTRKVLKNFTFPPHFQPFQSNELRSEKSHPEICFSGKVKIFAFPVQNLIPSFAFPTRFLPFLERRKMGTFEPCYDGCPLIWMFGNLSHNLEV